jgi:protein Mpv17
LNIVAFAQFVFWTLVSCPPNFLWQEYIEEKFPGYGIAADGARSLNVANTAKKFVLDQTIGALVNTAAFIAAFAAFKGKDGAAIQRDVQRETLPLMINGWKLWPLVSILNFTLVPVQRRILVGSVVGLFWGIYLSLIAAS